MPFQQECYIAAGLAEYHSLAWAPADTVAHLRDEAESVGTGRIRLCRQATGDGRNFGLSSAP